MIDDGIVAVRYDYPSNYGKSDVTVQYAGVPGESFNLTINTPTDLAISYIQDESGNKVSKIAGVYKRGTQKFTVKYKTNISVPSGGKDKETSASTYSTDAITSSTINTTEFNSTYNTGCYFIRYASGAIVDVRELPVYPQEFSDNNEVNFSSTSILGRSVAYQTYNHTSRSVSFSLNLHEEIVHRFGISDKTNTAKGDPSDGFNYDYIHNLVSSIQSACYPEYSEGIVNPPEVEFIIGKQFAIRGVLTSCPATWTPPIIDGHYTCCNLSIGITETTGPYSMSEAYSLRGYRKG